MRDDPRVDLLRAIELGHDEPALMNYLAGCVCPFPNFHGELLGLPEFATFTDAVDRMGRTIRPRRFVRPQSYLFGEYAGFCSCCRPLSLSAMSV